MFIPPTVRHVEKVLRTGKEGMIATEPLPVQGDEAFLREGTKLAYGAESLGWRKGLVCCISLARSRPCCLYGAMWVIRNTKRLANSLDRLLTSQLHHRRPEDSVHISHSLSTNDSYQGDISAITDVCGA